MKFADYFKEAIAYGESLGLRNGTKEAYADFCVELDEPKLLKIKDTEPFYPMVLIVRNDYGLSVDAFAVEPEQQLKLVKMFASAYEQYLVDKKEPVAADSNR